LYVTKRLVLFSAAETMGSKNAVPITNPMPKTEEREAETNWQGNADKLRIFIFIRSE
jgi:hypothetical protein